MDAVLDVGGVYDPERDRYDHHQRGFYQVFGHGFTTKLSSAGLVYKTAEKEDQAFHTAMSLTGTEFLESVHFYGKSWLPARSIVAECLADRHQAHESGEIMVLKQFCPWKQHLFEIEEKLKLDPNIKYAVYQDERSGQRRVQAVAVVPGKFESRKALPVPWRGLRDEDLSKEAGIEGCVFVHMSGFIGGAETFGGTLELAKKALSIMESSK